MNSQKYSSSSSSKRGHRICDQCGAVETTVRFRICSGCMATQYCSPDCQRIHWPSHKALCQHTMHTRAAQGITEEHVAKSLRKFTSSFNSLLSWAGFQALRIKRHPANISQHALLIELSMVDVKRFSIQDTHIVPLSYVTDPMVMQEIRGRDMRSRQAGGIGALVIIIQCGSVSQVMPVEVDHPSTISWDTRDDWLNALHHFVDNGITEFRPTASRGAGYQ